MGTIGCREHFFQRNFLISNSSPALLKIEAPEFDDVEAGASSDVQNEGPCRATLVVSITRIDRRTMAHAADQDRFDQCVAVVVFVQLVLMAVDRVFYFRCLVDPQYIGPPTLVGPPG